MVHLFTVLFYQPILNLLVIFYDIIPGHDIGITIIILTVLIKLIILPFTKQQIKSQKALQELQPKTEEIKRKYADNKEEMSKAIMNLYKKNKVNPLSSCLPLVIQLPILWAVYRVFRAGLTNGSLDLVYSFVSKPDSLNPIAFGFFDLSQTNIYLAILAALAQFWQAKMMVTKRPEVKSEGAKDENMMAIMNKQMIYMMPIITIFIGMTLPSGLMLYWLISTLLLALQQKYIFSKIREDGGGDKKGDSKGEKVAEGEIVS